MVDRTSVDGCYMLNDYYVYVLLDEYGSVYYVGRGRGDRLNQHLRDTRTKLKSGRKSRRGGRSLFSAKEKKIIHLLDTTIGYRAEKIVRGLTMHESMEAESEWIEIYGMENLLNDAMPYNRGKKPIPPFVLLSA